MLGIIDSLDLALPVKQHLKPLRLFSLGDGVDHGEGRRVGSCRILEAEDAIVLNPGQQVHGLDEVFRRFARKADNDVSRKRDRSACRLDPGDALQVPVHGVLPGHSLENPRRARLHRQMDMVAKRGIGVDDFDNVLRKVPRMAGSKSHTADAPDLAHRSQQLGEAPLPFRIPVAVHVLAQQLDLGVALVRYPPSLLKNGRRAAAALFAPGIWHNAVGAELVASFNDGDVAAIRVLPGSELGLEGLVSLAVVQAGDARLARFQASQHLRQFAVGCRPRHQRDIRRPLEDLLALLLSHTPENAEAFPGLVQFLIVVEAVEDLLFRLVADGAGVVKDQAGVFFTFNLPVALLLQCANDLFRVMGIHLAAERFKVEGFFGCHGKFKYTVLCIQPKSWLTLSRGELFALSWEDPSRPTPGYTIMLEGRKQLGSSLLFRETATRRRNLGCKFSNQPRTGGRPCGGGSKEKRRGGAG